jgi:hypothetical protein
MQAKVWGADMNQCTALALDIAPVIFGTAPQLQTCQHHNTEYTYSFKKCWKYSRNEIDM